MRGIAIEAKVRYALHVALHELSKSPSASRPCELCAASGAVAFQLRCSMEDGEHYVLVDCFICASSFSGSGEDHDVALADALESLAQHYANAKACRRAMV